MKLPGVASHRVVRSALAAALAVSLSFIGIFGFAATRSLYKTNDNAEAIAKAQSALAAIKADRELRIVERCKQDHASTEGTTIVVDLISHLLHDIGSAPTDEQTRAFLAQADSAIASARQLVQKGDCQPPA